MTNKRKIFGFINLVLFLASFCFSVFSAIKFNVGSSFNHTSFHFIGKTAGAATDGSQQLSENSENEYEDDSDLEMEHIQLPYYYSFDQIVVHTAKVEYIAPIQLVYPKPIYLTTRQFLI